MKDVRVKITDETIENIMREIDRRLQSDINSGDLETEDEFDYARVYMKQGAYSAIVAMVNSCDELCRIWTKFSSMGE